MNLSLSDVLFVGLVIVIVACGLAGLGELRDWLSEGRELDRMRRLADLDNARGTPVSREQPPLADLVVIDPRMEALCCVRCRLGDTRQPCTCRDGCGEDDCLAWANAISNTEEWER